MNLTMCVHVAFRRNHNFGNGFGVAIKENEELDPGLAL